MKKLAINLWFDDQAEEAAKFYTEVFKDSKMGKSVPYTAESPSNKPVGSVLTVDFELNGLPFIALNGGPMFKFNESISIVINCDSNEEADYYWEKLSAVPESEQCGWLKDKYGVSWQVVPPGLEEALGQSDPKKAKAAMEELLKQHKLDVAAIQKAADEA